MGTKEGSGGPEGRLFPPTYPLDISDDCPASREPQHRLKLSLSGIVSADSVSGGFWLVG